MLKAKWEYLSEKLMAMSLRERAIILATGVVLMVFIWLQFVFMPIEDKQKTYRQSLLKDAELVESHSLRMTELNALLMLNPNEPLQKEQLVLKQSLAKLGQRIEEQLSHLLAPEEMVDVMKQVLADYKGLRLLKARNLPVEPLNLATDSTSGSNTDSESDNPNAAVFAHGFEIQLRGDYFQALAFVQYLESMSGFFWHALDYRVDAYPKAHITIQLNTLSLEEDWIGV